MSCTILTFLNYHPPPTQTQVFLAENSTERLLSYFFSTISVYNILLCLKCLIIKKKKKLHWRTISLKI